MGGVVRTNSVSSRSNGGIITIPTGNKLVGTEPGVFTSAQRVGEVVQVASANTMVTSDIIVNSLTEQSAALKVWLTPQYANSKIEVRWWSSMMNGSANAIITMLYRSTDGGSTFVNLTPFQNAASRYYYGWNYNTVAWRPVKLVYIDTPGSTGNIVYRLNYRNISTTSTNYLVYQYMEYGWDVTEIAQ